MAPLVELANHVHHARVPITRYALALKVIAVMSELLFRRVRDAEALLVHEIEKRQQRVGFCDPGLRRASITADYDDVNEIFSRQVLNTHRGRTQEHRQSRIRETVDLKVFRCANKRKS